MSKGIAYQNKDIKFKILSEKDLMQLIILPLTHKGKAKKRNKIELNRQWN